MPFLVIAKACDRKHCYDSTCTKQVDSREVQQIKSLIRSSEARSAARVCGCDISNLHFLDMPFYETGRQQVPSNCIIGA